MNEIDWSKAPEGATHYLAENKKHGWFACWYKYGSNEWLCMSDSNRHGWIADNDDVELFEPMLIKRPTTPSWSGEGLPPVGVVCEWKEKTGFQWVSAEVLFISESSVVMKRADGYEWQMMTARTAFRPIRTPEQIAADGREEAINALATVIGTCKINSVEMATTIYDEGYRKP